jgi:hypothetical protein
VSVKRHPMRALRGTDEAKELMAQVRSHRGGAKTPRAEREQKKPSKPSGSYREIAERHLNA